MKREGRASNGGKTATHRLIGRQTQDTKTVHYISQSLDIRADREINFYCDLYVVKATNRFTLYPS